MRNLIEKAGGLDAKKKVMAGVGIAAVLGVVGLGLSMTFGQEEALLFAGLEAKTAGEIALALDAEGVPYDIRGERIYVPADQRDRLRLTLAQRDLPGSAGQGYELLDTLDGFSTTSEMFNVTYWRAKEGELARTLLAMDNVTAARVHIGAEEHSPFGRRSTRRTASVTLTTSAALSPEQLRAVRHLTALSVPGMLPEDVGVVDTARGLLQGDDRDDAASVAATARIEDALLAMLEARLGAGNARVEVALESVRRREEIASSTVDPDSVAVLSRSREENKRSDRQSMGAVTIASDLPDGETGEEDGAKSTDEGVREDVTYAVSTTNRKVEIMPGGIERLSVAVLVNESALGSSDDPAARQAELDILESLVSVAAGVRAERGDVVTLRALAFSLPKTQEALPAPPAAPQDRLALLPLAGVGIAALLLGAFVLRPLLGRKKSTPPETILGELKLEAPPAPALEGEPNQQVALPAPVRDPVAVLREQSAKRPEDAAALLNAWLDQKEAAA